MWRDWFVFSRQDQRAIILLSSLIVATLLFLWGKSVWYHPDMEVDPVADSIALQLLSPTVEEPIVRVAPHAFNPNTADSLELLTVGLPPYVVRNVLRYRRAGGQFRRPDDLSRIYGLHDTVYAQVRPYIAIPAEPRTVPSKTTSPRRDVKPTDTVRREHPYASYMRAKFNPGERVDVNKADTAELMRIPGIGPVYAKMIVDYRHRLGGYQSVEQLRELDVLPHNLTDWVYVGEAPIPTLRVNALSLTQLRSHPYLTFYQAKAIVDLRKREGDIRSLRQLLFLDEFTETDIKRLAPYLSFE